MPEQTTRGKATRDAAANALDAKLLLKTLTALKKGDFSVRLPSDWAGESGIIANTINDVIDINNRLAREMERVSRVVGREEIGRASCRERGVVVGGGGGCVRKGDESTCEG